MHRSMSWPITLLSHGQDAHVINLTRDLKKKKQAKQGKHDSRGNPWTQANFGAGQRAGAEV